MTYLKSVIKGLFYYLYMIVDIFSRMIVGWSIHPEESADHAGRLISDACLTQGVARDQLILHSDNGGPMKGATMLVTLQFLGVLPSFSRPRVSDDNPYSESLFKTLKYRPEYPDKPFSSIEDAEVWVQAFVNWYNYEHLHSSINYVTPYSR
ncbi:MAG: transposase, partial [Desulfobacteraceae bacterium]